MESGKKYYKNKETLKKLGISYSTLKRFRELKKIKVIRLGNRNYLYDVEQFLQDNGEYKKGKNISDIENVEKKKQKICYCRVSSHSQSKELNNQVNYMKLKYPNHEILQDIGSGINFKRKNFLKVIDLAINNELDELVIAYRDRLCRISYDLIKHLLEKFSKTTIIIVNDDNKSPEKEVTDDLLEIITVFSSRLYGLRSYQNKTKNI
jgi:putative resolvase